MSAALSPKAASALQRCRFVVGGSTPDSFSTAWDAMTDRQRVVLLDLSRQPACYAQGKWLDIPGNARCILQNNLYRLATGLVRLFPELLATGVGISH